MVLTEVLPQAKQLGHCNKYWQALSQHVDCSGWHSCLSPAGRRAAPYQPLNSC